MEPVITITASTDKLTAESITLNASVDIENAVIEYSTDQQNWSKASSLIVHKNITVYFRAAVGDDKYVYSSYEVKNIDKDAPVITVTASEKEATTSPVVLKADFSDPSGPVKNCQYKLNDGIWRDYPADGITVKNNAIVYFRSTDALGNTGIVYYNVNNINKNKAYIFVNPSYTAANTNNKKFNNYSLVYNTNTFNSAAQAENKLGSLDSCIVVMTAANSNITSAADIAGAQYIYGTTVINKNSKNNNSEKVDLSLQSKNNLNITDTNIANVTINSFLNVNITNSNTGEISGDSEYYMAQSDEKIKNSIVTSTSKETQKITSANKFYAFDSEIESVSGYKNVTLDSVNTGTVSSFNYNKTTQSNIKNENNNISGNGKNNKKIAFNGTLKSFSSVIDTIRGFDNITLINSKTGDIKRTDNDSGAERYGSSLKETGKYTTSDAGFSAASTKTENYIFGGKLTISGSRETASSGAIYGFDKVSIDGASATYVNNTSIKKYSSKYTETWKSFDDMLKGEDAVIKYDYIESRYSASGSLTLTNNAVIASASGYKTVKLFDSSVAGNIVAGNNYTEKYTRKGNTETYVLTNNHKCSFTAENSVIQGGIAGYATVKITDSVVGNVINLAYDKAEKIIVNGNTIYNTYTTPIEKISGKATIKQSYLTSLENYSAATLENAVIETLNKVNKVTVKKDISTIGNYIGTDKNDTFTISKGAVLELAGSMNFGEGKNKFVNNGTLIILNTQSNIYNADISGKGEIAATTEICNALNNPDIIDLGNTSMYFRSSTYEKSDDSAGKAVKWDISKYVKCGGWLGYGTGVEDTVDFVKLKSKESGTVTLQLQDAPDGANLLFFCNGKEYRFTENKITLEISASENYVFELRHDKQSSGSISYSLAFSQE